jgi:hypothetical protein
MSGAVGATHNSVPKKSAKNRASGRSGGRHNTKLVSVLSASNSAKSNQKVVLHGTTLLQLSLAVGVGNYAGLIPTSPVFGSSPLSNISDAFELYRFTALRFKVMPLNANSPDLFTVGYTSADVSGTIPVNTSDIMDGPFCVEMHGYETVTHTASVPRQLLMLTPAKWFHTRTTLDNPTDTECQGYISWGGVTGNTYSYAVYVRLDWTIELCQIADTSVTRSLWRPTSEQKVEDQDDRGWVTSLIRGKK